MRRHAKMLGESSVVENVRFLIALRDGLIPDATVSDRRGAVNDLMDRFGYPRLTQQQNVGDMPQPKLIDLSGWLGPDGAIRDVPLVEQPAAGEDPAPES